MEDNQNLQTDIVPEVSGAEQTPETQQEPQNQPEPQETDSITDSIIKKMEEMEREPAKDSDSDSDYLGENLNESDKRQDQADKPAAEQQAQKEPAKTEPEPAEPKTPEQEEEQILAMAQSERSKERLKQVFQERREGQQAKQSLGSLMKAFTEAGYDQDSMQTVLAIGRKVSSGDKQQMRDAIQMLDRIRSNLCQQIGEAPDLYDPLSDYPDLKKRVDEMGMDRGQAMEIVSARRIQAEQEARRRAELQAQQEQAAKVERVQKAQAAVGAFFNSKRGEIDFQAKMKAIQAHLTPERTRQFVTTVPPELWASQLELMYETIGAGATRPAAAPRPISARQTSIGHPANGQGATFQDDLVAKMKAMGI